MANLDSLIQSSVELFEINNEKLFFSTVSTKLYEYLQPLFIISNIVDETEQFTNIAKISGKAENLIQLPKLFGIDITKKRLLINEPSKIELRTGKLLKVKGGMFELTFSIIPYEIVKVVENFFNIGDCYGMGMINNNKLLGTIVFVLRKGQNIEDKINVIELYGKQATICIERLKLANSLMQKENQVTVFFESTPIAMQLYDSDGNLIKSNMLCQKIFNLTEPDIQNNPNILKKLYSVDGIQNKIRTNQIVKCKYNKELNDLTQLKNIIKDSINNIDITIIPIITNNANSGYLLEFLV